MFFRSLKTKTGAFLFRFSFIIQLKNNYFVCALSSVSLAFISLTLSMFLVTT